MGCSLGLGWSIAVVGHLVMASFGIVDAMEELVHSNIRFDQMAIITVAHSCCSFDSFMLFKVLELL